jgi:antitoxin component of MazEF toxin-antitoxin module
MQKIKVRKIGNSMGIILPKDSGVSVDDILDYEIKDDVITLSTVAAKKNDFKKMIEDDFNFDIKDALTMDDMKKKYGDIGWGE